MEEAGGRKEAGSRISGQTSATLFESLSINDGWNKT